MNKNRDDKEKKNKIRMSFIPKLALKTQLGIKQTNPYNI